jgi:Translation initiation factor eIF3 subunit
LAIIIISHFPVSSINIRKVKTSVDNLLLEKQKLEKGDKAKKKTPAAKVKARLRIEDDVSVCNAILFSKNND